MVWEKLWGKNASVRLTGKYMHGREDSERLTEERAV